MPDAALDMPVRIAARELLCVGAGIRMRCAVGIALERDGGHADGRTRSQPLLQLVILRLPFRQAKPPAVIVNDDGDVVRVVERRRAARERRIVEAPFWRSNLPDQLRNVVPVFLAVNTAAPCAAAALSPLPPTT